MPRGLILSSKPAHPWPVAPGQVSWQRETEGKGLMSGIQAAQDTCHLPLLHILSCHLHEALLDCCFPHPGFEK